MNNKFHYTCITEGKCTQTCLILKDHVILYIHPLILQPSNDHDTVRKTQTRFSFILQDQPIYFSTSDQTSNIREADIHNDND